MKHDLYGGRLHLYKRDNSRYWQCSAFMDGQNQRITTKRESLAEAKEVAEDWYVELRAKNRRGEPIREKTFAMAAEKFLAEFETLTEGSRSPIYVRMHKDRVRLHLNPFFGALGLSQVTSGTLMEYRIHRREKHIAARGKPPAASTMHQEMVCIRQILKTAIRHGWLTHLPDMSKPYASGSKISHRAWFSPEEYKKLYEATRRRVKNPKRNRYAGNYADMHDFVLFMANTGLRPDEAYRLEYRDVSVIKDDATSETILLIAVRGKRGVGYCKSMSGAVLPFQRMQKRHKPKPTDRVFPDPHRGLFNIILDEENLKIDREGNRRTAYSLRHTYICLRLMEGADIYQIAKNCRTSVEMIEKYYASHIASSLDAAAINVRKPRIDAPKELARKARAAREGAL